MIAKNFAARFSAVLLSSSVVLSGLALGQGQTKPVEPKKSSTSYTEYLTLDNGIIAACSIFSAATGRMTVTPSLAQDAPRTRYNTFLKFIKIPMSLANGAIYGTGLAQILPAVGEFAKFCHQRGGEYFGIAVGKAKELTEWTYEHPIAATFIAGSVALNVKHLYSSYASAVIKIESLDDQSNPLADDQQSDRQISLADQVVKHEDQAT